jgi:hypothetical protein
VHQIRDHRLDLRARDRRHVERRLSGVVQIGRIHHHLVERLAQQRHPLGRHARRGYERPADHHVGREQL